ncbi:MAG: M23 family metallopeptidase [Spirochaetales bacterium]|nr:MAG: M23 family metallopeptidase [Spirochaetales bacterium]
MRYRAALFCFLLFPLATVYPVDWPVKDRVLTATFGESRNDHFHNGIDLGGGEQSVFPVQEGEIIFYQEEDENEFDLPAGLGSFALIESRGGILSLYGHLKKGSLEKTKTEVGRTDILAVTGDTGYSFGKHLHLAIYDRELMQTVNPLLGLPSLADTKKPVIKDIFLAQGDELVKLQNLMSVKSGLYSLVMEVYDLSEYVTYFCPMAPYSIVVFAQGEEVMSVVFDALAVRDSGTVLVNKGTEFSLEGLYLSGWQVQTAPMNLKTGRIQLEIMVRDIAGNEAIRQYDVLAAD